MDDVKNVMVQNIEMVLERGEKLELLVDKTEQLQSSADTFKFTSNKLKNVMFWKTVRMLRMLRWLRWLRWCLPRRIASHHTTPHLSAQHLTSPHHTTSPHNATRDQVKFYAIIAFVIAVVIIIISMIACGADYSQCKSDDDGR